MRLSLGVLVVALFVALLSCTVDSRPAKDDLDLEVLRDIISLLSKRDSLIQNEPRAGPGGNGEKDQKGAEGDGPTGNNKQEGEPNSPPVENTDQSGAETENDQPSVENQVNGGDENAENNGENDGDGQGDGEGSTDDNKQESVPNVPPAENTDQDGAETEIDHPSEDKQKDSQDGKNAGEEQDTQQEAPGPDAEDGAEENGKVEENDKPPKPEGDEISEVQAGELEEPAEAPEENPAADGEHTQSSPGEDEDEGSLEHETEGLEETLDSYENLESLEKKRQKRIKDLKKMLGEALEKSEVGEAKKLLDKLIKHLRASESYDQQELARLDAISEELKMAENNLESAAALTSQHDGSDENTEENDENEVGNPGDLVTENEPSEGQMSGDGNLNPNEESHPTKDDKGKDQKEDKDSNKEIPEENTGKTEGDQGTTSGGEEENEIPPPDDDLFSENLKARRDLLKKLELIQALRKLRNDLKA